MRSIPTSSADRVSPGRSIAVIASTLIAIIAVMWIAVAISIVHTRRDALEDARIESRNVMVAFRERLGSLMRGIDSTMSILAETIRREGPHFDLYRWGRENLLVTPGLANASLLGPDGRMISTTLSAHPFTDSYADSEHFRAQVEGRAKGMFIGKTFRGRITGRLFIPISRRVEAPDGSLIGVLVMLLNPAALGHLYNGMDLGPTGIIGVIGADDLLRARYSADSPDGTKGVGEPIFARPAHSGKAEGSYLRTSNVDGIRRLYVFGRVEKFPLIVSVGLDLDRELADWRNHAWGIGGLALIASLLLAGLGAYLSLEVAAGAKREADLADQREALGTANAALSDAMQRAEAAMHAKSLFLANMSHELRTPLNAIIGYSQMIRDQILGVGAIEKYCEYAGDIANSGEHLLRVIVDVLDTAKAHAGKLALDEKTFELRDVIDRCLAQVQLSAERKAVVLAVDGQPPTMRGDPQRMAQVFINLLSNAVKFTPEHGRVGIAFRIAANGELVCAVSDTGVGMSAEDQTIALEPFSQVDRSLATAHEGTGLGLPLAKQLVELHGGRLEIDSEKDHGTTVRICLPASRVIAAPIPPAAAPAEQEQDITEVQPARLARQSG